MGKIWLPVTKEVYFTNLVNPREIVSVKNHSETSLVVQWLRLCAPNTGGLGSIPSQGTRSHMLQLRVYMPQLSVGAAK